MIDSAKLKKLFLFGLVGGFGTVLNTFVLYVLTIHHGVFYLLSSVIATESAIVSNFIGNHIFTFKDSKDPSSPRSKFVKFQIVSITTIIGTVLILWILTTLFGIRYLLLWNFIAILVMFLGNFFLNQKFTWREVKVDPTKT